MSELLIKMVGDLGNPRILVIGDVIVDRYAYGVVERMSPEAPVPVIRVSNREERLGGAAGVASMLAALDATVTLAGVVGSDDPGSLVNERLRRLGLSTEGIFWDASRCTTVKERVIGLAEGRHPQQMMRIDSEACNPIEPKLEQALLAHIEDHVPTCDAVLISDYGKGVCTPTVLAGVIRCARQLNRLVLIDPARTRDPSPYLGCSCLTPNRTETNLLTGCDTSTPELALHAAEQLRVQLRAEAVVVTLDRDGMALAHADGRRQLFPTRARQVYDVTGAGDMVLSVLGLCLAQRWDYEAAIGLANVAAGLEVEHLGVATLRRDELVVELLRPCITNLGHKVQSWERAQLRVLQQRKQGGKVVFTNGCFDLLHAGHVAFLEEARALGDFLVVGLNSDASVRRLKGPSRPVNPAESRIRVLAGLAAVDLVVVFDEDDPLALLRALRPDVLAKGSDYELHQIIGRDFVESYGGTVARLSLLAGHSTTRLVERITSHGKTDEANEDGCCGPVFQQNGQRIGT